MPIWKIAEDGPKKLQETKPRQEELLESNLEDWIVKDTSILGEPLLIIGRQVMVPDVKDKIDLLGLDLQGNAVVIELKRGKLKDPVDIQALRYASYISKWRFEEFENEARSFLGKAGGEFNFNELFEQFCEEAGVDEVPDVNSDQRIILVGSEVKDKLGSVALWLHEHNISVKVVEIEFYREGDTVLLQPHVIVPVPIARFTRTGAGYVRDGAHPWLTEGRIWHMEKRCSPETGKLLQQIDDLLQSEFDVEPKWNQKFYVAYRVNNRTWLSVNTHPSTLVLKVRTKVGAFHNDELAKRLGVRVFDLDESLSEKMSLPSSIVVQNRNESSDRVVFRIKEDFDLTSDAFIEFLRDANKALPA